MLLSTDRIAECRKNTTGREPNHSFLHFVALTLRHRKFFSHACIVTDPEAVAVGSVPDELEHLLPTKVFPLHVVGLSLGAASSANRRLDRAAGPSYRRFRRTRTYQRL